MCVDDRYKGIMNQWIVYYLSETEDRGALWRAASKNGVVSKIYLPI